MFLHLLTKENGWLEYPFEIDKIDKFVKPIDYRSDVTLML